MSERLPPRPGNGTLGPREIRGARTPRSPILERGERGNDPFTLRGSFRRIFMLAGVAMVAAGGAVLYAKYAAPTASSPEPPLSSGPCIPGENSLDRLDRRHDEEMSKFYPAILPGLDMDGCSVLSEADQLRSPLCCPHVSPDLGDCPRPLLGMGLPVGGGKFVILDANSLVPEPEAPVTPPAPGTRGGDAQ